MYSDYHFSTTTTATTESNKKSVQTIEYDIAKEYCSNNNILWDPEIIKNYISFHWRALYIRI